MLSRRSLLLLAHCLITWLRLRWKDFGKLVDGTPLVLLSKGRRHFETTQNMHLSDDDVMAAAREKGLTGLDQISCAVFERSGPSRSFLRVNNRSYGVVASSVKTKPVKGTVPKIGN